MGHCPDFSSGVGDTANLNEVERVASAFGRMYSASRVAPYVLPSSIRSGEVEVLNFMVDRPISPKPIYVRVGGSLPDDVAHLWDGCPNVVLVRLLLLLFIYFMGKRMILRFFQKRRVKSPRGYSIAPP